MSRCSIRESAEKDGVRAVARAQTLTVLRRLDGERKGAVVRFLRESALIDTDTPIVGLRGADLTAADFRQANLTEANLEGANLTGANLTLADLIKANLTGANLTKANLGGAYLTGANLTLADLTQANLESVGLRGTNLRYAQGTTPEQLEEQAIVLKGATMPDGTTHS